MSFMYKFKVSFTEVFRSTYNRAVIYLSVGVHCSHMYSLELFLSLFVTVLNMLVPFFVALAGLYSINSDRNSEMLKCLLIPGNTKFIDIDFDWTLIYRYLILQTGSLVDSYE